MLAVYVNCLAVIVGSLLGILFAKKISNNMSVVIQDAAGAITMVLGMQMAFQYQNIVYLALALILGGLVGTWIDVDGAILKLGSLIEKVVSKKGKTENPNNPAVPEKKNFAYAFLNSSVLFCVGAMAIIGSIKAGLEKDYTIIFTKSILDGFLAIVFAASMGIGTLFSFIVVFAYQSLLTLLAGFLKPIINETFIAELSACGGVLIIMIGINLLNLKKIKTANYLPAMIFTVIFVLLDPYFKQIINF